MRNFPGRLIRGTPVVPTDPKVASAPGIWSLEEALQFRAQNVWPSISRQPASQIISALGLSADLEVCLDAGDSASYTSGQSWLDTSGNGQDFFLGANGSAGADDPTFNGSAGQRSGSEYFSFDGGDYLTYDTTNEPWMNAIHQDNALFTLMFWISVGSLGSVAALCGTNGSASGNTGFNFTKNAADQPRFVVTNSGSSVFATNFSSLTFTPGWTLVGLSVDEAGSDITAFLDGLSGTVASGYSSPSASAATFTMQLAARGNANSPLTNGAQMGMAAMWSRALSVAEMTDFFNATRGRYGV